MCDTSDPGPDYSESGPVEYRGSFEQRGFGPVQSGPADPTLRRAVDRVLASEEARLLAVPGVVSVGIGFGPAGGEALAVGVVDAGVAARLPVEIEGVPVVVTVIGEVNAL